VRLAAAASIRTRRTFIDTLTFMMGFPPALRAGDGIPLRS
jgi:hypothetical protein